MAWLSFLKSKDFDPAEFERELARITKKISVKERSIVTLKYQERKITRLTVFYSVTLWVGVSAYALLHTAFTQLSLREYLLVFGIPLAIFLLRTLIHRLYQMKINSAEQTIEQLHILHASKIDELKEKTKYSSTQALLSRFGQGTDVVDEIDEEIKAKQLELEMLNNSKLGMEKEHDKPRRRWYDSVLDGIVGDDLGPDNRYALICENCLLHNGLAPPGKVPDQVKYICPRCGTVNGGKILDTQDPEATPEKTSGVATDAPIKKNREKECSDTKTEPVVAAQLEDKKAA